MNKPNKILRLKKEQQMENKFLSIKMKFIPPLSFIQLDDIVSSIRYYGLDGISLNYTMYIFSDDSDEDAVKEEISKDSGLSKDDKVLKRSNQVVRVLPNNDLVKLPFYFYIIGC